MRHANPLTAFFVALALLLSACQPDTPILQPQQGGTWNQSNFDQSDWQ